MDFFRKRGKAVMVVMAVLSLVMTFAGMASKYAA